MPKKSLDLKKVHEALLADPALASETPKEALPVLLELADVLPTVLKDHLEKKVTLESLMEARLAINEHMLESRFFTKLFTAVPVASMPLDPVSMVRHASEQFRVQQARMKVMIDDTAVFLASHGLTERQALASEKLGRLNVASLTAFDKRKLTIRTLLETQPTTIISAGAG